MVEAFGLKLQDCGSLDKDIEHLVDTSENLDSIYNCPS